MNVVNEPVARRRAERPAHATRVVWSAHRLSSSRIPFSSRVVSRNEPKERKGHGSEENGMRRDATLREVNGVNERREKGTEVSE